MDSTPLQTDFGNDSRTLFIPIKDSDEAVSIPAQELPEDAEEVWSGATQPELKFLAGAQCVSWRNRPARNMARLRGAFGRRSRSR